MNEPANRALPDAGVAAIVPCVSLARSWPVLYPVSHWEWSSAPQNWPNLNVKLICAYLDVATYLADEPAEGEPSWTDWV